MLDHDGVVVDSVEIFTTSFVEACRRVGLSQIATTDDVLALFEGNVYESLRAAGADDAQISAVMSRSAGALRVATPALRPFPLMPEVLADLAEARYLVIVSSNASDVVELFLKRHAIAGVAEVAGAEAGLWPSRWLEVFEAAGARDVVAGRSCAGFAGFVAGPPGLRHGAVAAQPVAAVASFGDERRVGDTVVEARRLHARGQAQGFECVPLHGAAVLHQYPHQRQLGRLEHVPWPDRLPGVHAAIFHGNARDAFAEPAEDVLRHHELLHTLITADAGVQIGEVEPARDAEHFDDSGHDDVLGHRRQVEPARAPFQPDEVLRLGDDGGDEIVVHPHGQRRRDTARDVAYPGCSGAATLAVWVDD